MAVHCAGRGGQPLFQKQISLIGNRYCMKQKILALLIGICMVILAACKAGSRQTVQEETVTRTASEDLSETTAETTAQAETLCHCEEPWQHAYAEYITANLVSEGVLWIQGIYIGDINADAVCEVVMDRNGLEDTLVLYYMDGEVKALEFETVSAWGNVTYIADTKQILFSPFCDHTTGTFGYAEYYLYDWTQTGYEQTRSLFRESGYYYEQDGEAHSNYGQSFIDGEKTEFDVFEAELAKIKLLEKENGYFPVIDKEDEAFAGYIKEKLPCLNIHELYE